MSDTTDLDQRLRQMIVEAVLNPETDVDVKSSETYQFTSDGDRPGTLVEVSIFVPETR